MGLKKPSDWYNLSYEEQQKWQKSNREFEDLEYEKDRAQETAERSARDVQAAKRNAEFARSEAQELRYEASELADAVADLTRENGLVYEYLREKSLYADFTAWLKNNAEEFTQEEEQIVEEMSPLLDDHEGVDLNELWKGGVPPPTDRPE